MSDPSSGSLYLAMIRMEEQGLLEEAEIPAGERSTDARRRYYRLTPLGWSVARERGTTTDEYEYEHVHVYVSW